MQHPMRILTPSFWLQLLTFCGCFGLSTTTWGQVFVRAAATGANDGSSWANAFTDLQLAIDRTANGQIWVAEGIYYPTQCNNCTTHDREQSFQLRDGLSLYGGFRGTESQLSERDVTTYLSRLSGDIGQKGDSTDNSYHVVVAEGSSSLSVLDGFVIEEGNADAAGFNLGGGLYINGSLGNTSSPYIGNCTFRNNYAGGGGAIGMDASAGGTTAPSIDVCTFEGNTASIGLTSFGGAILGVGSQGAQVGPQISNCQFFNNLCGNDGGAIAFSISGDNSQLSAIINQSIFSNNTANDRGGAIWSRLTNRSRSALLIGKCQFVGNRASGEGGAIYNRISFESRGNDQLNNCIFSQNQSGKSAGAIYLRGSQQGNSTFRIVNSQLDRNRASTSGGAMYLDADEFAPGTIDAEIINCSFANNRAGGTAGSLFLEQGGGQLTIDLYNSILWGGSIPSIRNQGASGNVAHCILQEDLPSGLANEGNNLQEDPDYADADNGDLHLLRCSPAIDAGNNSLLSNLYRLDLGENDRIYDNRIDMGAYENGQILYVHFLASGGNTGENWDNAFTRLEYALEQAEASNQIWIGRGVYHPTDGTDRNQSFHIPNGVEIYGGFVGSETELSQRNTTSYPVRLSGNIGQPNSPADNSYRVVSLQNAGDKTILDGLIIQDAAGDQAGQSGGGMHLDARQGNSCRPQIRNCTFRTNLSGQGGAIAMEAAQGGEAAPTFFNCQFLENQAINGDGGAIYANSNLQGTIASIFEDCLFENNSSDGDGGAIAIRGEGGQSKCTILRTAFADNQARGQGGAIANLHSRSAMATDTLINCSFRRNKSEVSAGAIFMGASGQASHSFQLVNCLLERNETEGNGGAIVCNADNGSAGNLQGQFIHCSLSRNYCQQNGGALFARAGNGSHNIQLANSIFWDNNTASGQNEITADQAGLTATHSIIQGGLGSNLADQGGNLFEDPQFMDAANGDLHTSSCSPAIDAASPDWLPADDMDADSDQDTTEELPIDLDENARRFGAQADMGCYEWDGNPPALLVDLRREQVSCTGACDGMASVRVDGGVPGYRFVWSTGDSTISIQNLCAGTYTVTITDEGNCQRIESVTVEENDPLRTDISQDTSLCHGVPTQLTAAATGGTGQYNYSWNNGLDNSSSQEVQPDSSTTYSVTITDANGCSDIQSTNVQVFDLPDPQLMGEDVLCAGTQELLTTSNAFATYLWSDGSTNPGLQIDEAGRYGITVTDANGCQGKDSIVVTDAIMPTPSLMGSRTFCVGGSTTFDPGSNYAAYEWSNGSLNQQLTVFSSGRYSLTVTDANGCTGTTEVFAETTGMLDVNISGIMTICAGASTTLEAEEFASYAWSNGANDRSIEVNTGGTYRVTVTDGMGCSGTDSVLVLDNTSPVALIVGDTFYCAGTNTILGVQPAFNQYEWSDGSTASSLEVDEAGSYQLTVTDANGCTAIREAVITQANLPRPNISGPASICEGEEADLTGGLFGTYRWSTGDTIQSIRVDQGGNYELTVTDANGCQGSEAYRLIEHPNPRPQIGGLSNFCPGGTTQLNGETYNNWNWSTGDTTQSINVSTAGSYQLTVTDANGCVGQGSLQVMLIDSITPDIIGDLQYCQGGSTQLSTDDYLSYRWSTGDTTQSIDAAQPGQYLLQVRQRNGCEGSSRVDIRENPLPSPLINGSEVFCVGDSSLLSGENGFLNYSWSTGDSSQSIFAKQTNTYSLTVTDANGCQGSSTLNLRENAAARPVITGIPFICEGGKASLFGGVHTSYLWSTGDTTSTIEVDQAGSYSLTVTDVYGCSAANGKLVRESPPVEPTIGGQLSFCTDESTRLTGGNYSSYIWSTGDTTASISVNSMGSYSITVTDAQSCTGSDTVRIVENAKLVPDITGGDALCDGETSTLNAGTFDFYLWSGGETTEEILANGPGLYIVTVSDESGCEGIDSILIDTRISSRTEEDVQLCFGDSFDGVSYTRNGSLQRLNRGTDGCDSLHSIYLLVAPKLEVDFQTEEDCVIDGAVVHVAGSGGTGPYTYLWEDDSTDSTRAGLSAGTYLVTITDELDCELIDSIQLNPSEGVLVEEQITDVQCHGEDNGSIDLIPQKGNPPFVYQWSTGDSTASLVDLASGEYRVLIRDANGCNFSTSYQIMEPSPLEVQVSSSPPINGNDGMAMAVVRGGITPYRYQWSNGDTGPSTQDLSNGSHRLTVTDANGCMEVTSFVVGTTASHEAEIIRQLHIFPNPSTGLFQLEVQLRQAAPCQVRVFGSNGQQLQYHQLDRAVDIRHVIDLSTAAAGSYFLDLEIQGQHIGRQLLKLE